MEDISSIVAIQGITLTENNAHWHTKVLLDSQFRPTRRKLPEERKIITMDVVSGE